MTPHPFQLVFRGQLDPTFEHDVIAANLQRLTGWNPERVEIFLASTEVVVKRGLDHEASERYRLVMERAGIICHSEQQLPAGEPRPETELPSPLPPAPPLKPQPVAPTTHPSPSLRPEPPAAAVTPPTTTIATETPATTWLIALVLVITCALGWWVNFPVASELPAKAYFNPKGAFALTQPADWLMITPENYKSLMETYRDRFPEQLRDMIGRPGFEVSFVKLPDNEEDFATNLNVIVMPLDRNPPVIDNDALKEAEKAISQEMIKVLPDYTITESRLVEIDGLKSLSITGTAEIKVITAPSEPVYYEPGAFGWNQAPEYSDEIARSYRLTSLQTMVPGRKRAYLLSCSFDDATSTEGASECADLLQSFVVTERPPRFGSIVMGSINGALIGMGAYLAIQLVGRLFGFKEEVV